MKNLSKCLFAIIFVLLWINQLYADSAGRAGAYLKMGVGARALGMGSAFTAVADDATAAFWNPAGLALLNKNQASFMHANLTLDRKYNFVNYAHILKNKNQNKTGVLALSHIRFGIDGIPETRLATGRTDGIPYNPNDNLPATNPDGTYTPGKNVYIFGYFDNIETSTFCSYAQKINDKWLGGINLKYLKQELFTNSADSFGLDIGLLYLISDKTKLGISVRDIKESLKWDTDTGHKDKIPITTTVGIAHKPKNNLILAFDINKVEDLAAKLRAGVEWWIRDFAAVRIGSQAGDFTLGSSFKFNDWQFDYSYVDEVLGEAHRISASKSF